MTNLLLVVNFFSFINHYNGFLDHYALINNLEYYNYMIPENIANILRILLYSLGVIYIIIMYLKIKSNEDNKQAFKYLELGFFLFYPVLFIFYMIIRKITKDNGSILFLHYYNVILLPLSLFVLIQDIYYKNTIGILEISFYSIFSLFLILSTNLFFSRHYFRIKII